MILGITRAVAVATILAIATTATVVAALALFRFFASIAAASVAATIAATSRFAGRGFPASFCRGFRRLGASEPGNQARKQARRVITCMAGAAATVAAGSGGANGGRLAGRDALHRSLGASLAAILVFLCRRRRIGFFRRIFSHGVAGLLAVFLVELVMAQTHDAVLRGFHVHVGNQHQIDAVAYFDLGDVRAFFIEQESGNIHRHLAVQRTCVFLHGLFFKNAQDVQCRRFGRTRVAGAVTARAGDVAGFSQCRAQPLTRQFEQAEATDLARLHAGAIIAQGIPQAVFDFALVAVVFHVDEIDHDQATQVAQTQLAGDFIRCFAVGLEGSFLDVGALGGAARVDVDGNQRFRVVNDDGAAGRQIHLTRIGRLDLVLDLETREEGDIVTIAFDAGNVVWHDVCHELLRLLENVIGVDENFADFSVKVIAYGANHQAGFLIDEEGTGL